MRKPQAVIMAGGQGERFWPLTHSRFPKYLIRISGQKSLLQKTFDRLTAVYGAPNIHVVTTKEHRRFVEKELPRLGKANLWIEPFRNNTASAIFLTCAMLAKRRGREVVLSFFPADHLITNEVYFKKMLKGAIRVAREREALVMIGIRPTFPAVGYGYIEQGALFLKAAGAYRVKRFVEKPSRTNALRYIRKKSFFWNSGIFTWRAGVLLGAYQKVASIFHEHFDEKNLSASYRHFPKLSIDRAVMEKADNAVVIPAKLDWTDLGSWDAYLESALLDKNKNHTHGVSVHRDLKGCLVINHKKTPVTVHGLSDVIVVQTEHGTLVCKRGRSEEAALLHRAVVRS